MDLERKDSRGSSQLLHPLVLPRAGPCTAGPALLPRDAHGGRQPAVRPRGQLDPGGHGHWGQQGQQGAGSRSNAAVWGVRWGVSLVGSFSSRPPARPGPAAARLMSPRGRRGTRGRTPGGSAGCATAPRPCGARPACAASGATRARPSSTAPARCAR